MTRPINEAPLPPGRGQEDPRACKGLFLRPQRGGPSPATSRSCPTSFFHPGPQERKAAVSAQRSLSSPHLAPRSAPQHPHPRASSGPASGRACSAHPPEPGRRAASAYLAGSQATPEQLRGPAGYLALIAQAARIRERAAGTARGEERKSQGICLVITRHKTLGVSASPVAQPTRREGGWGARGPVGPGALPAAPLRLTESYVSSAAPSQPLESLPSERPFPAAPGSSRGGPAWGVAVETRDGLWGPK